MPGVIVCVRACGVPVFQPAAFLVCDVPCMVCGRGLYGWGPSYGTGGYVVQLDLDPVKAWTALQNMYTDRYGVACLVTLVARVVRLLETGSQRLGCSSRVYAAVRQ